MSQVMPWYLVISMCLSVMEKLHFNNKHWLCLCENKKIHELVVGEIFDPEPCIEHVDLFSGKLTKTYLACAMVNMTTTCHDKLNE